MRLIPIAFASTFALLSTSPAASQTSERVEQLYREDVQTWARRSDVRGRFSDWLLIRGIDMVDLRHAWTLAAYRRLNYLPRPTTALMLYCGNRRYSIGIALDGLEPEALSPVSVRITAGGSAISLTTSPSALMAQIALTPEQLAFFEAAEIVHISLQQADAPAINASFRTRGAREALTRFRQECQR